MDRAERRLRTLRAALRQKKMHMDRRHADGVPDCLCELSTFYFEKRRGLGCGCSKKTRGRPKIGRGLCYAAEVRPTVLSRRLWRAEVARLRRDSYE